MNEVKPNNSLNMNKVARAVLELSAY